MSTSHSSSPPRGIDHLVIAAKDLDGLAEHYRGLGFQVGPRNRHPWGTENHIVQFDGAFLELIGVADAGLIPERAGRRFSFGGFVRDFLKGGDGLAMLALESRNAIADAGAFKQALIGDFETFFFERTGQGADGQPKRVSFTLAFAEAKDAPRAGFFTCQQHQPQNFWNPERQVHANGVTGVAKVFLVAGDPSDYHEFLDAFINQREMRATSYGLELDTGRGLVEVLSPEAFQFRFGRPAPVKPGQGLQFAAIQFGSKAKLPQGKAVSHNGLAVIPAEHAGGVVLAFQG